MSSRVGGLRFPGYAAGGRGDEGAESSYGPAELWVFRCKRQRKQMIFGAGCSCHPFASTVCRCQDHTARSGDSCTRLIYNVEAVKSGGGRRDLRLPFEATVTRPQDGAVAANSPAGLFVSGKSDGVNRITL